MGSVAFERRYRGRFFRQRHGGKCHKTAGKIAAGEQHAGAGRGGLQGTDAGDDVVG